MFQGFLVVELLLGFYEAFLGKNNWWHHWPVVIRSFFFKSIFLPSPPPLPSPTTPLYPPLPLSLPLSLSSSLGGNIFLDFYYQSINLWVLSYYKLEGTKSPSLWIPASNLILFSQVLPWLSVYRVDEAMLVKFVLQEFANSAVLESCSLWGCMVGLPVL